jgi:hypothetical protein
MESKTIKTNGKRSDAPRKEVYTHERVEEIGGVHIKRQKSGMKRGARVQQFTRKLDRG